MSKSRIFAISIGLAILFTIGGLSAITATPKDKESKTNVERIRKMFTQEKGKKGQDYAAESTAAVEGASKGGLKADDSEKFKKDIKEVKDKVYKDSEEVKQ